MSSITAKTENYAKWYEDVISNGNLASPGLVKGTLFIHPQACYIWEKIQSFVNSRFFDNGIKNVLFPALIPLVELEKEKQKLTGFIPELFLVKESNNTKDKSSVFLRPTSEILFSHYFQKNLESYEDLPILLNQWSSVYRAEKNTKAFLRNCEFYWQEAHTIHETYEDAMKYLHIFHSIYSELIVNFLNIHVLVGEKTINERFVGALETMTAEAVMPDGQVLQMATSHYLGQNFTTTFDIKYTDQNNVKAFPHQLSAGCSTRLIGAIIMSHSDDIGLVLPWNLASIKVQILVLNEVIKKEDKNYQKIVSALAFFEHKWDFSNKSFGQRINKSEKEGTPIVLIVGPKELAAKSVMVKSRIKDEKVLITILELNDYLFKAKKEYENKLRENSKIRLANSIKKVKTLEELIEVIENKKVGLVPWFNDEENEVSFKEQKYNFGPRCIHSKNIDESIKCFYSNKVANCWAYFGRSY